MLPHDSDLHFVEELHDEYVEAEELKLAMIIFNVLLFLCMSVGGTAAGLATYNIYKGTTTFSGR